METKKLTLAITKESFAALNIVRRACRDSIGTLLTSEIDNDTLRQCKLTDRVFETVRDAKRDPGSVELILADSGKSVTYNDFARAVDSDRSVVRRSEPFFGSTNPEDLDRLVHLVAICNHNIRELGIPWGCFPDQIDDLLPVAGLGGPEILLVNKTSTLEEFVAFVSSHAHPFRDAVLVDQYLMTKADSVLRTGFAEFVKALTCKSPAAKPRITLIETSKRFDSEAQNDTSEDIVQQDLSRLESLVPNVEWSVVLLDLAVLKSQYRAQLRHSLSAALHDRVLITNSMLIKSGNGFAIVAGKENPKQNNRSQQPVLLTTFYDRHVVLDCAGRSALLNYTSEINGWLKDCLPTEKAAVTAGSPEANRLLEVMHRTKQ